MKRPMSISVASIVFALAIGAGIAESVISVCRLANADALTSADVAQIAVRAIVYVFGLSLALLVFRGRNWARWVLAIMIGVLWLGTLVAPMSAELATGESWGSTFGADISAMFPGLRALHLLLVPVGLLMIFRNSAHQFLDASP